MSKWYFRDGTLAVTADIDTDKDLWREQMGKVGEKMRDPKYKIVKQETLPNNLWVSTVWLGLDHSFSLHPNHKPLIFETMVFKSKGKLEDLDMDRYSTEEEAIKGHKRMVNKWKKRGNGGAETHHREVS